MITIEVTQTDIDGAIQVIENDRGWDICTVCPIARALNRVLPSSKATWHVGDTAILADRFATFESVKAALPKTADAWRDQFDQDFDSVKPFTFEIGIDPATVPA